MIRCQRLILTPATAESVRAERAGPGDLAAHLGLDVPESWPPALYDDAALAWTLTKLEAEQTPSGWWLYYFSRRGERGAPDVLIGAGGYKGPPDRGGSVEIGCAVLPGFRRLGYAREAVDGLVRNAFAQAGVKRVVAETSPQRHDSIRLLDRCGFRRVGEGSESGTVRYQRTRSGK